MTSGLTRVALFAMYQLSVLLGIVLMPAALAAGRLGVRLPVGRLVDRLGRAYDEATAATA